MTWGVVRPKLLLPEAAEEWPEEQRRAVLLHELAHAHRWDYATNLIARLACAIWWFNPLTWLAARRMAAERERACDDIVLNQGARPSEYARQVLAIAAGLRLGGWSECAGIAMARSSKLEGRLRAILDSSLPRRAPGRVVGLLMLGGAMLVILPVALMRAASAKPGFRTVTGRVVDAETHQPILKFNVTPGIPRAAVLLTWSKDQMIQGQNGVYQIEWDEHARENPIKVEAPGYLPEMAFTGPPTNVVVRRDFELHKGDGFSATVLAPDGRAVAGAQVAYSLMNSWVNFAAGQVENTNAFWATVQKTPVVITDSKGRFSIPGAPGILSLIVHHDDGFAEIPRETLGQTRVIRLQSRTNAENAANQPGFKVRLLADRRTWPAGTAPQLTAEIRNDSRINLLSSIDMRLLRVEVDGRWYGPPIGSGTLSEVKATSTWTSRVVTLNQDWNPVVGRWDAEQAGEPMYGQPDVWDLMYSMAPLGMSVGKHTIRLAVFAVDAGAETVGTVKAVSEPVEIEIAAPLPAAPTGKSGAIQNSNFGPATNGLSVRVELAEGEELMAGQRLRIFYHVRNVTNQVIKVVNMSIPQSADDELSLEDDTGRIVPRSPLNCARPVDAGIGALTINPGEEIELEGHELCFLSAPENVIAGGLPCYSYCFVVKPGPYTARFKVHFSGMKTDGIVIDGARIGSDDPFVQRLNARWAGAWEGTLETGPVTVNVKGTPEAQNTPRVFNQRVIGRVTNGDTHPTVAAIESTNTLAADIDLLWHPGFKMESAPPPVTAPAPTARPGASEKWNFGPAVNGLRAALELEEDREVTGWDSIRLRFRFRNETNHTIQLFSATPRPNDDLLTVTDEGGQSRPVGMNRCTGLLPARRVNIAPGEEGELDGTILMFLTGANAQLAGSPAPCNSYTPGVSPGQNTLRFKLFFGSVGRPGDDPGDWHGTLETWPVTVKVKAREERQK